MGKERTTTPEERKAAKKQRQMESQQVLEEQSAGLEAVVRRRITESGLSAYALGQKANISRQQMSRFINGERGLTLQSLDRLCYVLGLVLTEKTGTEG